MIITAIMAKIENIKAIPAISVGEVPTPPSETVSSITNNKKNKAYYKQTKNFIKKWYSNIFNLR